MTELRTSRLLLRRAVPGDAEPLHTIFADPRAMKHWSTLPHESLDVTRDWLDGMLQRGPGFDDFIIERNGRVIGKAGAWRMPEIGYILHPDVWGQGIAIEAMSAVIPHLFAAHADPALTADVDPGNVASIRVLEKLGFEETHRAARTFFIGGKWFDSVYLALTRARWSALNHK
jgi:ribosomal-protein-alanine N-acetyltransferase